MTQNPCFEGNTNTCTYNQMYGVVYNVKLLHLTFFFYKKKTTIFITNGICKNDFKLFGMHQQLYLMDQEGKIF